MKRLNLFWKIPVLTAIFFICFASAVFAADASDDMETVKERYRSYYLSADGYTDTARRADEFIKSQLPDGIWSGIVYDDEDDKTQTAYEHLRRLVIIINAATAEGSEIDSDAARTAVEKGLEAWNERVPLIMNENGYLLTTKRWWNDTIGQQLHFMIPIVTTGYNFITKRSMEIAMSYFLDDNDMHNYPELLTGANLIWYQNQGIIRSLFSDDYDSLRATFERMTSAVCVSKYSMDEGIQADSSFHQHGPQEYFTYSSNFFLNVVLNSKQFQGTSIENKKIYPLIAKMILDGDRWFFHGGEISNLVVGRNISSKYIAPSGETSYTKAILFLSELYPEKKDELLAFRKSIIENDRTNSYMTGNRHFWCSDMTSHKRSGWSAVLSMFSERTISTESNAVQNANGSYVGAGTLFLSTKDNIQNPNMVCFDWGHIPGVTSPSEVWKITRSGTFVTQEEDFVGGVSDGRYGASAMKTDKWTMMANKSYFFFDDCYVAMGSGILSARGDICTTVDQRGLDGTLYINGTAAAVGEYKSENVSNIYADKIGYVFPNPETLNIRNGDVTSSWASIQDNEDKTSITQKMFTVWKSHDNTVGNRDYCYIVYPNITQSELSSKVRQPSVSVIESAKSVHAVISADRQLAYAVFFESGACRFGNNLSIEVDKPCIVMLRSVNGTWRVSVSDPTAKIDKINVKLIADGAESAKIYNMPKNSLKNGETGGMTVTNVYSELTDGR